jgi:hypothetical protein
MPVMRNNVVFLSFIIAALLAWRPSFAETTISEKTLSSDIVVKEAYQPGSGLPVGKIKAVRGEAIVFHRDLTVGYRTRTGLPLYQGDTIRTQTAGWILCELMDGSQLALMAETTLTITNSSYNSVRKTSASFLQLEQGSVRFKLKPLPDLSSYEFKVQTKTAFIAASKADFVVKASPETTEIIAFDKSRLEVSGTAAPAQVILLSDFQRKVVRQEMASKTVETISREEADTMMAEFHLTPRTNLFASGPKRIHEEAIDNETPGDEVK